MQEKMQGDPKSKHATGQRRATFYLQGGKKRRRPVPVKDTEFLLVE